MSLVTSFKHYSIYTLRKSLGPMARPQRVLLITRASIANRPHQLTVSVLPLSSVDRKAESEIRVKIHCRSERGSAELDCNHFCAIDGMLPVLKADLILASGTPILAEEKREIGRKLASYLGFVR